MLALGFITNLAYSKRFTNRNIIQVIGLAILLLATKPNNVLLLGLIPFVPLEFEGVLAFLNRPVQAIKTFISKYKVVLPSLCGRPCSSSSILNEESGRSSSLWRGFT